MQTGGFSPELASVWRALRFAGLALLPLVCQGCGEDLVAPDSGVIQVTVTTSGPEPDPDGYTVRIDSGAAAPLGVSASADLGATAGEHTVDLEGLAANCTIQDGQAAQRTIQVHPDDTTLVTFDIVCTATGGALVITTATTGGAPDADGYLVALDGGNGQPLATSGTLTLGGLAAGDHTVAISGIAPNCRLDGDNPRTVTIAAGASAATTFTLVCFGPVATWTRVSAGTTADLTDVWAASPTSVFLVGEGEAAHGRVVSVIRHFDGTQWVEQHRETDLRLRGLWGSSAMDVYAVGFDFFAPVGRMLHYDGSQWTEVPGFVADAEELSLESVWGSSPSDIFTVGSAFDGVFDRALIYRLAGSFWQRMLVPGAFNPGLMDVWGTSPTDVYAVGQDRAVDPGVGLVLHYDGAVWTAVFQQDRLVPNAIWGSSATDVFVVGFQVEQHGDEFTVTSAIWHFDGSSWAAMTIPKSDAVLQDVWGASPSDVYAVGDGGTILHYDGTQWTATHQTSQNLLAVSGDGAGNVYVVGDGGLVLRGTP